MTASDGMGYENLHDLLNDKCQQNLAGLRHAVIPTTAWKYLIYNLLKKWNSPHLKSNYMIVSLSLGLDMKTKSELY